MYQSQNSEFFNVMKNEKYNLECLLFYVQLFFCDTNLIH